MSHTVRALHSFLAVWLTVTAAVPPCCWSMGSAHDHQARSPEVSQLTADDHHHHHATHDATPVPAPASNITATHTDDCNVPSLGAMTATRITVLHALLRIIEPGDPAGGSANASISGIRPHNLAPPGSLPHSAFLSPLRI